MRHHCISLPPGLLTAILSLCLSMTWAGCHTRQQPSAEDSLTVRHSSGTTTATLPAAPFATDSARMKLTSPFGTAEVYIDYPTGNDAASREAKSFIHNQLFGRKPFRASNHPDSLAKQYCEMILTGFEQSLEQLRIGEVSQDEAPEEGTELRLIYVSDQYITYESWHYSYFTGGGHGTYGTQGITIRRSDGKRMTRPVNDDDDELRRQMIRGLMAYFGVSDTASLAHYLTVPLELLPMPAHPPYLTADGLRFQYELYDICPLDDGAPAFTIPLDSLSDGGQYFLTGR